MLCRHSVQDECRILLLHGLLHLVGHDHELGPDEEANMARQEQQIMQNLGWKVSCMIDNSVLAYCEPLLQTVQDHTCNNSRLMARFYLSAINS